MPGQRVLITGAGGFLGRHLCRRFAVDGWRVLGVDRRPPAADAGADAVERSVLELPDPAFAMLLRDFAPDVLIHAAGPASVPASVTDPDADYRGTVGVTAALLDALRQAAPQARLVYLSSGAVYGNAMSGPVGEAAAPAPISPYAYHKWMGELLCEQYRRLHGLDTQVVRIFSAYGPGQRKQVVYDLFSRLLDPRCTVLEVIGSGREARDFIHAEDIAGAIAACVAWRGEPCVNIGTGQPLAIADLVGRMLAVSGIDKPVRYSGQVRAGDPDRMWADVARLKTTGFAPRVTLDAGLRDYCDWLRGTVT